MNGLPEGWAQASLSELGQWASGGTPSRGTPSYYGPGTPWVKTGDLRDTVLVEVPESITPEGLANSAAKLFPEGTLLVAMYGATIGRTAVLGVPAATNQACAALVAQATTADVIPYVWWFFRSKTDALKEAGQGGAQPNISQEILRALPIALAPLAEQRRIVAKLDALTARTDRARADLDRIPALAVRYKQAVIEMALSGRLSVDWRRQRDVSELAEQSATITTPFVYTLTAPSSWRGMPLLQACEIVGGSQPPKSTFVYAEGEGLIRLVQIRDYKSDAHIVFIPERLARRFCDESDVMIGRYGPPVFQILRGLKGAYNVALMKAVPLDELLSKEYLFWLLSHPTLRRYVELDAKRTAGQDGVNKAHLEKFPIFLPSLEEQAEIVVRIERSLAEIDRLFAEATAAHRLLDRLDQAILAKAFRGELVPQDPADQPASALLERIRAERAAVPKHRRGRRAVA